MSRRILSTFSTIALTTLVTALVAFPALPAHAALATVANAITTSDLNTVGATPLTLAQSLAGPGISISNATFTGDKTQAGTISVSDPSIVSFNSGVIMSSGNVADIVGPNKSESTTGDFNGPGDQDLDQLIAATQTVFPATYDATTLQFDFVPTANKVYFTYTFSSDEYLEWVNLYNDVFGLFVNGKNCAVTPAGDPVSIDTINSNVNSSLYRDNGFWNPPTNPINIESDGLSVEMICSADVNPGVTNHIKFAIADTSDHILDSVVMIKAHSVSITPPESCNNGNDDNSNGLVDMNDDYCKTSTTPAPPGIPTVSGDPQQYSGVPFTGNEGDLIVLDANAMGWAPTAFTSSSSWSVTATLKGTGTCAVQEAGKQPLVGGKWAIAHLVCTDEGEYTVRIDGWDSSGGSETDFDVDFFVHNAPPQVNMVYPSSLDLYEVGTQVTVYSSVVDYGLTDTVNCELNWGDGTVEAANYDTVNQTCEGTHSYSTVGHYTISTKAWDNLNATAAVGAYVETYDPNHATQAITVDTAAPASAAYGSSFTVAASTDSGLPVSYSASGGCTNFGPVFTMTSGTVACKVFIDAAGDATYSAAPQVVFTVSASKRNITVTADNKTKVLGDLDPALTWSVTSGSLVSGDALSGSLTRVAGTAIGTYAINKGTLAAPAAYAMTFVAGSLSITGSLPVVTGHPTSQDGGVGQSVTFSSTATASPVATVQWQSLATAAGSAWKNITGATAANYTVVASAALNGTQYKAIYKNAVGSTATNPATLSTFGITSFTPASGIVGSTVTITGTNLLGTTGVKVGGVPVATYSVTATTITATVPVGAATGTVQVLKGSAFTNSTATYTVTIATKVTALSPTSGGVGTSVTLTGTAFTGATAVKFAGTTVSATFTVISDTSIVAAVPVGATATGGITVTVPAGSTTSTATFKPATTLTVPTVTAYSTSNIRVGTGTVVTLTGTNLAGASDVKLNTTSLPFVVKGATSLQVTVPNTGVTSGPIRVTTDGGTSVNTISFNVLSQPTSVVAGASHSCAVLADQTAKCWGLNTNGQLGNASTTQSTSPVSVFGLAGVSQLSAGTAFTCAVISAGLSGTASCWGLNTNGQLGNGTTAQSTSAVNVSGLTAVTYIDAGASHACAVISGGTVKCWGLNANGQLGNGTTTQATTPVAVSGITNAVAVSAGATSTCALLATGQIKCWGLNTNGQLGNGLTTQSLVPVAVTGIDGTAAVATSVSVGTSFACAIISGGGARCWGLNTSGQLGNGTTTQSTTPVIVKASAAANLAGVISLSAGATHVCVITTGAPFNSVLCWGANTNGRLGNATTTNSSYPVAAVVTLTAGATVLAAGGSQTLVLAPSVALSPLGGFAWGANTNGQLGTGSTTSATSPVAISSL